MKTFRKTYLPISWIVIFALLVNFAAAQEATIDAAFKIATIEQLNTLLVENYVFPKVAKATATHLNEKLEAGDFDTFQTAPTFAEALTKAVQAVNKDKHMRIRPTPPRESPDNTPERMVEDHLDRLAADRENRAGFRAAKRLDGNIGYLDLREFTYAPMGTPVADHYMQLLANTDAMIIDLRHNGGGDPEMVQYLCSYFFGERVHLNSLYWRQGDQTQEFWTLEEVGGTKMPDVPLFVLTSNYTFSGAEEFSYNMQTQKRATLIGETTGGGANPGGGFMINEQLMVFIPTGRAINPITGTNWEGVGVIPEVKTAAAAALDKAIALATTAAEAHRQKRFEQNKIQLTELYKNISQLGTGVSEAQLLAHFKRCIAADLLTEGDINQMGYHYLEAFKNPKAAIVIFKANTELYPNSANVFDSYAEGLLSIGKQKEAVQYYQKAVELAEKHQSPDLEVFRENLSRAKRRLESK